MKKILVIEDEEDIRLQLLKILKLEGFEPIGAENGTIGIQTAKNQLPALIICDVMMPGVNGYGVLAEVREDSLTASIPFVFLTAKSEPKDFRKGMTLGADDYLTKPFAVDELLSMVRLRLEKHEKLVKQASTHTQHDNPFSVSPNLPANLRTPLRMLADVSASLSNPKNMPEPGEIAAMAGVMHKQSLQVQQLVENALLYADLKLLRYEPHTPSIWQRNDFIDTEGFITFFATHEAIEARRENDLALDLTDAGLRISAKSLQKILRELLKTAFQSSKPGDAVLVTTTMLRGQFCLKISDRGAGMSRQQLTRIMNSMKSDLRQHEQHAADLHVGLMIACFLARLCGGNLTVDSVPNQGTTMTFLVKEGREMPVNRSSSSTQTI